MPQTHTLQLNVSGGEFLTPPPTALEAAVQRALLADELQKPGRIFSCNHERDRAVQFSVVIKLDRHTTRCINNNK